MPKLRPFACPSCGASLSVEEGAATTKCQFCGNTVIVPEEIRGTARPSAAAMGGLASGAPLKELGNLIRAGNKLEAIKLYRELFGTGLAEAQSAVDRLSLGQSIQVTYMGMPTTLTVDRSPHASARPTPMVMASGQPMHTGQPLQPVVIGAHPGRSLGCVMWIIFLSVGLTLLIGLLTATGALLPMFAMFASDSGELPFGLGEVLTDVPALATGLPQSTRAPAATPTPGLASPILSFGSEGTGAGAFDDPRHVAVDGDGNIYVGEWEAHRVQVFDADGDFVTQYSVGDNDAILTSMAVDRDGALFAVAGGRLYHYDGATGEQLGEIEYGDFPHFDVVVTTADGSLVTAYNSAGADNLIRFNRDFEVDLEVPDVIETITGDAETVMHLAVDGNGAIFILGLFHESVFRFSPEGVFQNQFGGEGGEPGQFIAPGAIALDRQSRVYVSDFKGIQVFEANGRYLDVFDVPDGGYVHGLAVDDDNFLYAVSNNSKVYKFALNP